MGNFIHYLATFFTGLVVGFVAAWRLALLSVAVIPGIAFAGGLYAYTLTGLTSKSRESYANAGIVAEQASVFSHLVFLFICTLANFFLQSKREIPQPLSMRIIRRSLKYLHPGAKLVFLTLSKN